MRAIFAGLFAVAVSAGAATINFNSLGSALSTYTEQGVTFTPVGGGTFSGATSPDTTLAILADGTPRQEMRADIAGGASFVSVDLGDFDADADLLFLQVFNSSNVSLGFTSLTTDASDSVMHTLSLSASGISYAIMGGRPPALNGSSVFIDNFTFTAGTATTPEPATILLTGAGLAILALRRRRA